MDVASMLLIAVGLAMDAFAVSITHGVATRRVKVDGTLKMAVAFGSFQAFMPVLGWTLGTSLNTIISGVDHWVAFGLLSIIGVRMIYGSRRLTAIKERPNSLKATALLMLSVATSIDALVVGLSFSFLRIPISTPVLIIGITTFILSFVGVSLGNKISGFFRNKAELFGGIVLVLIGIRILADHLI